MQTVRIYLKNSLRSFSSIIGLTVVLTCTMFTMLSMRPELPRFQCNCAGYPKQRQPVAKQLFPVPVMLYAVQPAASQDDPEPCIE